MTNIRKLTKKDIRDAFEKWYDKKIPAQIAAYGTQHSHMIVDVFVIRMKSSAIITTDLNNMDRELTFPFAKVLQVGDHFWDNMKTDAPCPYKAGGLVRLKDLETLVLENPRYELWRKNEYSNANVEQIGQSPPARILNLWDVHGRRMFALNPFETDMNQWEDNIFYFDTANILMPVERWQTLFEAWK